MGEIDMIWWIMGVLTRDHAATTLVAKAVLKWVREKKRDLKIPAAMKAKTITWCTLGNLAAKRASGAGNSSDLHVLVARVAAAVQLDAQSADIVWIAVAADRMDMVRALIELATENRVENAVLIGSLAGLRSGEARHRIVASEPMRLGLLRSSIAKDGGLNIQPSWRLDRLLDRAMAGADDAITELMIGRRQVATLAQSDFARVEREADFMIRLLRGALAGGEKGINILIHGPPGTGKTELARTLAAAAAAQMFSVGEADDDGEEPNRWDRVTAYRLAQRVAEKRPGTMLLFDEMEDLIGNARPSHDDYYTSRDGSKIFVNRLFETNAAPTVWTTNALGNIDPAILRRMSFILKLDYPTPTATRAMLARVAGDEAVMLSDGGLARLADHAPETGSVLRNALRAGRIAGVGEAGAAEAATSLVTALRGGGKLRLAAHDPGDIDLGLYEAGQDLAALVDRLANGATPDDFSLLLTGPPGTGKTGLAHALARRLDRPLIVKRASDLLSKWVGETEQQIAEAFEEALAKGGVLLFDEVDSLLFDRGGAQRSWEVTQVNELLTWFDSHPLPFIAATNHGHKLDPAALRRFVFKIDLKPLSGDKAAAAYTRFFGHAAPAGLGKLSGLTPGDLAVVARQLRYAASKRPGDIIALLAAELAAKPESGGRIGF